MRKQLTTMQQQLKIEESMSDPYSKAKNVIFNRHPTSDSETDSDRAGKRNPNKVYKFDTSYRNTAYWKLPD